MIRINPVYRKELKQTARTKKVMVLLMIFNSLLAVFGLFSFYFTFHGVNHLDKTVRYSDILLIYAIITGIEFILILFITPGITAGSIAGEREKQTLDILLSTTMTPCSIIRGKLIASINLLLMLSFSSLPIIAIVFSFGGITVKEILRLIFFLCVTAIYIGSIGIFFSSICKRSTIATVCTYATLLVLTIGLTMLLMGNQLMEFVSSTRISNYIKYNRSLEAGNSFLLLLINPIFTFTSLLKDQVGFNFLGVGTWRTQHQVTYYIFQHWFAVSIAVQITISILLNFISARAIQPGNHIKKKRKGVE